MILVDESGNRRYLGLWRGFVASKNDPKTLGRIKARVPDILGPDLITDWAFPILPNGGGPNIGSLPSIKDGSRVWIQFEQGLIDRPLWCGFWAAEPKGEPDIPFIVRGVEGDPASGGDGATIVTKGTDSAQTHTGSNLTEPSPELSTYPFNFGLRTSSGIVEEFDDATARHQIFHPTGTYQEEKSTGDVVSKAARNRHEITIETVLRHAKNLLEVIDQDSVSTILGTLNEESDNRILNVKTLLSGLIEKIEATVNNGTDITINQGGIILDAIASILFLTIRSIEINSVGDVKITAPLTEINGSLSATSGMSLQGSVVPGGTSTSINLGGPTGFRLLTELAIVAIDTALVSASNQAYSSGQLTGLITASSGLTTIVKAQ